MDSDQGNNWGCSFHIGFQGPYNWEDDTNIQNQF